MTLQVHAGAPRAQADAVTSLLTFMAGEHAKKLAILWSMPHSGFYMLPTARRHAAAMLATGLGARHALTPEAMVRLIERQKDRTLAELLVGPAHSAGFMKVLSKLGEMLWTEADYARLLALYTEDETNRFLRHADEVEPYGLKVIHILPSVLRQSMLLSFVRHERAARDVATAYQLVGRIRGEAAQMKAAERWTKATKRERLFEMVREDLIADGPVVWAPPPALPAPFRKVETAKELKATGLKFKNCVMDFVTQFTLGRMAFYVWEGSPEAVVSLNWNIDGWRLSEAEAASNADLDEPVLRDIVSALEALDIRIGTSIPSLNGRTHTYGHETDDAIAIQRQTTLSFHDKCDLGELWDY